MFLLLALAICIYFPLEQLLASKEDYERLVNTPGYLLRAYKITMIRLWVTALIVFTVFHFQGVDFFSSLGLAIEWDLRFLISMGILAVVVALLFSFARVDEKNYESTRAKFEHVAFILPRTRQEFNWVIYVAFTAGVCEEIIYRGFLVWFIDQYSNIYISILVANVMFALAHIWSGPKNMVNAFGLGLVLSLTYLLSGSLWIPILLHFFIDVHSGLVGYRLSRFQQKNEEEVKTADPVRGPGETDEEE